MRRILAFSLICIFCFSLTACGPRHHSTLAGAAVGAGVGTLGSAAVDGHPLVGALLGAGVGSLVGAAIDHDRYDRRHHHGWHGRYRPAPRPHHHRGWR